MYLKFYLIVALWLDLISKFDSTYSIVLSYHFPLLLLLLLLVLKLKSVAIWWQIKSWNTPPLTLLPQISIKTRGPQPKHKAMARQGKCSSKHHFHLPQGIQQFQRALTVGGIRFSHFYFKSFNKKHQKVTAMPKSKQDFEYGGVNTTFFLLSSLNFQGWKTIKGIWRHSLSQVIFSYFMRGVVLKALMFGTKKGVSPFSDASEWERRIEQSRERETERDRMSLKFLNLSPVPYEKREMLYRVEINSEVRLISCVLSLLLLLYFI